MFAKYLVLLALAATASVRLIAGDLEKGWTCTLNSNGISHYERWVAVNSDLKVRERRVEMEITCNLEEAVRFLQNPESSRQWMRGIKEVNILPSQGSHEKDVFAHTVFNFPWPFKDQDMVAQYRTETLGPNHYLIRIESRPEALPVKSNMVRIWDYQASWELILLDTKAVRVVFWVYSAEAPRFPRLIQDPIVKKMFRNNFDDLKNLLCNR